MWPRRRRRRRRKRCRGCAAGSPPATTRARWGRPTTTSNAGPRPPPATKWRWPPRRCACAAARPPAPRGNWALWRAPRGRFARARCTCSARRSTRRAWTARSCAPFPPSTPPPTAIAGWPWRRSGARTRSRDWDEPRSRPRSTAPSPRACATRPCARTRWRRWRRTGTAGGTRTAPRTPCLGRWPRPSVGSSRNFPTRCRWRAPAPWCARASSPMASAPTPSSPASARTVRSWRRRSMSAAARSNAWAKTPRPPIASHASSRTAPTPPMPPTPICNSAKSTRA